MQKKVAKAKNKKAPLKGASNVRKKESIFNYDEEVKNTKNKKKAKHSKNKTAKKIEDTEYFLDTRETPKISKKQLDKIKKKKKKEAIKKAKEIKKQEIKEEKQRVKNRKKLNPKYIAKKQKTLKLVEIMFLILIVIIAILLFLLSPIFKITKIEVKGNEKISSDEIISLSKIVKDTNLFKISKKETISNIKENAYIQDVNINRKIFGTIEIEVKERIANFYIEFGGAYAYIDNNGYILEINTEKLVDKPKIVGYKTLEENINVGNKLDTEDIENISTVINILNVASNYGVREYISSVNIENNNNYILYLENEHKTVNLGDMTNIDIKMLYMQSIIEKEKDKSGTLNLDVDFRNKYPYASWL